MPQSLRGNFFCNATGFLYRTAGAAVWVELSALQTALSLLQTCTQRRETHTKTPARTFKPSAETCARSKYVVRIHMCEFVLGWRQCLGSRVRRDSTGKCQVEVVLPTIKLYWNLYLILSIISVLSAIISTYWWWFTSSKQHSNCVPLDRIVSCTVSFIVKTLWCPLLVWLHWKTDTRVAPLLQHQDECWSCTLLQTADMEQLYVYPFSISCCENTAV